jgi:hypothetical protein
MSNYTIDEDGTKNIRTTKIILSPIIGLGITRDSEDGLVNADINVTYYVLPFLLIKDYRITVYPPNQ